MQRFPWPLSVFINPTVDIVKILLQRREADGCGEIGFMFNHGISPAPGNRAICPLSSIDEGLID